MPASDDSTFRTRREDELPDRSTAKLRGKRLRRSIARVGKRRSYLGLACSGHDDAVALVDDHGEVVFAEAIERPLQTKRALLAPVDDYLGVRRLIEERCPPEAEIVLAKTWSHGAAAHFAELAREATELAQAIERLDPESATEARAFSHLVSIGSAHTQLAGRTAQGYLQRRGQLDVETRAYDHHLTHAAAACLTGPFEEAACMIVDGLGEHGSTRAFRFDRGRLEVLEPPPRSGAWPASLGFFFMEVCALCGFEPALGEEWKVMGLAAYGRRDPRIVELMRRTIAIDGLSVLRPAGAFKAAAELRALRRRAGAPVMDAADLAYAGQLVFAERMEELLRNLRACDVPRQLVLGGGCALNSAFNGTALARSGFDALHVFCAPADDGNAVGAALLAWREDHPDAPWSPRAFQSPYLGSSLSSDSLDAVAASGALLAERLSPDATIERAADLLADGRILGWAQGRAELGPRALGNRSILADPRRPEMKARVNATVKLRESYRPFAPAILHERGEDYFLDYRFSPYMERALVFREEVRDRVPAVVHADGTGRLQSVTATSNPRFHALLRAFHARTGVPLLLNTSLNVMGKPIVHSVEDAVALFATSGLDAMFIEDLVLTKRA